MKTATFPYTESNLGCLPRRRACRLAFLFLSNAWRISEFEIWLLIGAAVCAAYGFHLFFNGFRMLRLKRRILNTPLSRVHSASIGLVELKGTPIGPYVLTAPVTGDPCYYYHVRAWQWVESDNKHHWQPVMEENRYVPFFLEDETGRVLVDPQGAEMDVHRSFSDEIAASLFRTPGMMPPHVRDFLAQRGLVPSEKIRVVEEMIPQQFPLFVFGTLGDAPAPFSFKVSTNLAPFLRNRLEFSDDGAFRFSLTYRSPWRSASGQGGASSALGNVLRKLSGASVKAVPLDLSAKDSLAGVNTFGTTVVMGDSVPFAQAMRGTFAQMDAQLAIASTDRSKFGQFDLHPKVALCKGERGEPFIISRNSHKEVAEGLAWKSVVRIWVGPLLAIAGVWYWLASLHLIP